MERWIGKVAIVTGASAGIGASIAEKLVKEGINVVGFSRRRERVEELSQKLEGQKGKLYPLKVDISKEDEIIAAFKWVKENVGPVNILINNAGVSNQASLINGETQKWRDIFETNVLGLCIATREAIRAMRENNIQGHIVHINSLVGHKVLTFHSNVYPASKFAVTALAETLRHELNKAKSKIKITDLSPGVVRSEFAVAAGAKGGAAVYDIIPSLNSEDIADGVLYALGTPPHVLVQELTIIHQELPF